MGLYHILSNAIKFNLDKKGLILIKCKYAEQHLVYTITDSGQGMTQRQIKESKNLFGNVDTQGKQSHLSTSGIGVGISSSYKIAKGLGGDLEIDSIKNQGTCVRFSLKAFQDKNQNIWCDNESTDEIGEEIEIANLNVFGELNFNIKDA